MDSHSQTFMTSKLLIINARIDDERGKGEFDENSD